MTQIKPQPTNVSAERAVLAGLCQHGSLSFTDVTEFLSVDCFSKPINQNIFRCLEETFKSSTKVDYPTIIVKAKEIGITTLEDKTNQDYIVSLFNYSVEKETIKLNASSLKKLLLVRQAQNMIKDMYVKLGDMSGSEKLSEILSIVEEPIYAFSNSITSNSGEKTELLFGEVLEYIEYVVNNKVETIGVPSPWPKYNEAIGGGRRRGSVYLTSARPKQGKSSLCINDAVHCAHRLKIPVLYIDTEMKKNDNLLRCLARLSKIPMKNIEKGNLIDTEIDKLICIGKELKESAPLYYRRVGGKSFAEIVSIVRNFIMQVVGTSNGVTNDCLICYDYFKLMDTNSLKQMQEYQALGFQIQELTDLCSKYDVPCSAYVQLNREEEVAQSDRLVWLASSIAKIKRKSYEEMELDGFENGNTKLILCEQRFGPGLEDNDYINLMVHREKCIVDEIGLKSEIDKDHQGFSDHDGDDDDESF